jgi:hypothetical protein
MLLRTFRLSMLALACFAAPAQWASAVDANPSRCSVENPIWCQDGVGGAITSLDTLRVTRPGRGREIADSEENAQGQARNVGAAGVVTGMSASTGNAGAWTVWGSGAWIPYQSKLATAPYDADTYNFLLGADRVFGERVVAGFTLGYENTDINTDYNGGGQERDGLLAGVYGAYLIDDVFSVDAALGYSALDTDENRVDPGTVIRVGSVATPGVRILGSYDSDRVFGTINFNAVRSIGSWVMGGRIGALYANESQDAYTETGGAGARNIGKRRLKLGQVYASLDVGYSAGNFEPYTLLGYRYDVKSDDGSSAGGLPAGVITRTADDDDWMAGIGVRYFGDGGVAGSIEWLKTLGRDKFEEDSLTLMVRVPF